MRRGGGGAESRGGGGVGLREGGGRQFKTGKYITLVVNHLVVRSETL